MHFLKLKNFVLLNLFCLLIINDSNATIKAPFENIIIYKKPIIYSEIKFEDINNNTINLKKHKGSIVVLNFWATWCLPCKEEMPSLDKLQINNKISNIKIFPINLENKNLKKTTKFFEDLNIKNISFFFDPELNLVKLFSLRGVPTTIFINREGKEFARVIGSIDFSEDSFINWISKY